MPARLKAETEQRRRDEILQAAAGVFARQGFRGSSIKDIAKRAGVADGTIYNAFANKDALLAALLEKLRPAQAVTVHPSDTPSEFLMALFEERLKTLTPDALAVLRVVLSEALVDRSLRAKFFKLILQPAIDPMDAYLKNPDQSRLIVSLFLGVAVMHMLGEPHITTHIASMPKHMAQLLTKGLTP
jgi:AcrR family transcriptional regulator